MIDSQRELCSVDVSLTNVQGLGAVQLVQSLLPALERVECIKIGDIFLPARGPLADYERQSPGLPASRVRRYLPNSASRFIECLRPISRNQAGRPLLVLGDIPLKTDARQTVFVHNSHLLRSEQGASFSQNLKFSAMRRLFRSNLKYADFIVVQTGTMREQMVRDYPELDGRMVVLAQPPPSWLSGTAMKKDAGDRFVDRTRLRLFYPAAAYPHKNHALLLALANMSNLEGFVDEIIITVEPNTMEANNFIRTTGRLRSAEMQLYYGWADALIFPSLAESYGLPLVEAMWVGLPILCADRPYARELCGSDAIYFNPMDPASAEAAVGELHLRLTSGWLPDWSERLARIPRSWDNVAERLASVSLGRMGLDCSLT